MKLLVASVLVMSNSLFASSNGYDLKMEMSLNAKTISSPRIVVKENQTGSITQKTDTEENFIEVTASEGQVGKNKGILMKFTIGSVLKNGQRTILSEPQILAKENEPAKILIDDGHGGEELSLTVIAKRTSL